MDSAILSVDERSNIDGGSWFSRLSPPLRADIPPNTNAFSM